MTVRVVPIRGSEGLGPLMQTRTGHLQILVLILTAHEKASPKPRLVSGP